MARSLKVRAPTERFSILNTLHGHEVIDHDGRPVSRALPSGDAERIRDHLNFAAYTGLANLAAVLAGEADII